MTKVYIGLNTVRNLSEIDNKETSLANLNLNSNDIGLIRQIDDTSIYSTAEDSVGFAVTIDDIHTLSALDEDRKATLLSLARAGGEIQRQISSTSDISTSLYHDLVIDQQYKTRAFKYNYLNLDATSASSPDLIKKTDLSNLRFSAFSELTTGIVTYSGNLKVVGDKVTLKTGGKLITKVTPVKRTFRSEVATKTVKVKIDGSLKRLALMKGIPLIFDGFFKKAQLIGTSDDRVKVALTGVMTDNASTATAGTFGAGASSDTIPVTVRITNLDDSGNPTGTVRQSGDDTTANPGTIGASTDVLAPSTFSMSGSKNRARRVEVFYDPVKIKLLGLRNKKITEWTNVSLPNLEELDIELNELSQLPSFRGDTVALAVNDDEKPLIKGNTYYVKSMGTTTTAEFTAGGATAVTYELDSSNLTTDASATDGTIDAASGIKLAVGDAVTIAGTIAATGGNDNIDDIGDGSGTNYNGSNGSFIVGAIVSGVSPNVKSFKLVGSNGSTAVGTVVNKNLAGTTITVTSYVGVQFQYTGESMGSGSGTLSKSSVISGNLAPALKDLKVKGNDFSRALDSDEVSIPATSQLNTLPLTIENLEISGSFQDNQKIDLTDYTALKEFAMNSGYLAQATRAMISTTVNLVSPEVVVPHPSGALGLITSGGIQDYRLLRQTAYKRLCEGVYKSTRLKTLQLYNSNSITRAISGVENIELQSFKISNTTGTCLFSAIPEGCLTAGDFVQVVGTITANSGAITAHTSGEVYKIASVTGSGNITGFTLKTLADGAQATTAGTSDNRNVDGASATAVIKAFKRYRVEDDLGSTRYDIPIFEPSATHGINDGTKSTLQSINFYRTMLNVINVQGCISLTSYVHQYANNFASNFSVAHKSVDSKFGDNGSLNRIDLTGSSGIVGNIQSAFSSLSELSNLILTGTSIHGILNSDSFSGTDKLSVLRLSGTQVGRDSLDGTPQSTFFGTDCFANTNLTTLRLDECNSVQGSLPNLESQNNLQALRITGTQITGGIPTFANNVLIENLNLTNNNLTGQIPSGGIFLGNNLRILALTGNNLTGDIFEKFSGASYDQIYLNNNNFTSAFPDLRNCPNLFVFAAKNNQLSGYVSGSLSSNTKLTYLQLANNNFNGPDGSAIIRDLYENYLANPSSSRKMNVILTNQNGLTEFTVNNDGTFGDDSTANKLAILRSVGWSINLDGTLV